MEVGEGFNTISHGLMTLAAIPLTIYFLLINKPTLFIFGFTGFLCYLFSSCYHGCPSGNLKDFLEKADHAGIYLFILGTYVPVVDRFLNQKWNIIILFPVFILTIIGIWLQLILNITELWIRSLIYITIGWISLFCYAEMARKSSHKKMFLLVLGGIFYTIGAGINIVQPTIYYHELFHVFVMIGTLSHLIFLLKVV